MAGDIRLLVLSFCTKLIPLKFKGIIFLMYLLSATNGVCEPAKPIITQPLKKILNIPVSYQEATF